MARRTVRDLRCPSCARVFKDELVRHMESGDPPATAPCPKCKGTARVLPVTKINVGGTLWSQEESRSRQVYGEDGMREGKRISGGNDYERALEKRNLAPADERQAKLALEKANDMGRTFQRLREQGDAEGTRKEHINEIASRNGSSDLVRQQLQIAEQIRSGASPMGRPLAPHEQQQVQQQVEESADPRWDAATADKRWAGMFVPDVEADRLQRAGR